MHLLFLLACVCGAPSNLPFCSGSDASDHPGLDTGPPTDDGDDEPACDTGLVQLYLLADFTTSAGAYVDASFGYGYAGLRMDDWACRATGTLPYEGPAPEGCPGCEWAFDLAPATDSLTAGDYCAQFGFTDGALDGYFDYAWGFAEAYAYDYDGAPRVLENTLFVYVDGGWSPLAFDYGGRDWVTGDAEHLDVVRPALWGERYAYYYYYPYPC